MSERKVINKYYPPDFDPIKLPRGEKPKNGQVTVRLMMPCSVRCRCGEFIYRGKKFNAKKETVMEEEYFGVKIFRFYMRCPNCSAEFTLKTDPKNSDYVAEMGCSRNFEPWRANEALVEEEKKKRENEETGDAMKALENRTNDSKVEMDIIDALEEIRALNARNSKITPEQLIEKYKTKAFKVPDNSNNNQLTAEDEEELNNVVFKNISRSNKRPIEDSTESQSKKLKTEQKDEVTSQEPSSSSIISSITLKKPLLNQKKPIGLKIIPKITPKPKTDSIPKKE